MSSPRLVLLVAVIAALGLSFRFVSAEGPLDTPLKRASYGIGADVGRSLAEDGAEVDIEALIAGMRDALAKKKSALTPEELRESMVWFNKEMRAKAELRAKEASEKNLKEGQAYLAANAKAAGVQTLKSGLQVQVLKQGAGVSPKATDTVKVHYHGTLIDGAVFDSSVQRGEPAQFPVGRVIPGWVEALQLMKVGDKWKITIPSNLAYGENGTGPIGPNAVLVFEVELLEIVQ